MTGLQITRKGDKLYVEIDMSAEAKAAAQPSKSGKTKVLASTHGFVHAEGVSLSLNATLPA